MIGCQAFSKSFFEVVDQLLAVKWSYLRHTSELKICGTCNTWRWGGCHFHSLRISCDVVTHGCQKAITRCLKASLFLFLFFFFIFVVFSLFCGWTMTRCTMHFPTGCFLQLTQPRCSSKCRMRTTTHPSSPGSSTLAAWPKTPRSSALCSR